MRPVERLVRIVVSAANVTLSGGQDRRSLEGLGYPVVTLAVTALLINGSMVFGMSAGNALAAGGESVSPTSADHSGGLPDGSGLVGQDGEPGMPPNADPSDMLPDGLSLVGLDGDTWRVFVARGGALEAVPGVEHPRASAYHGGTGRLAYVAADNHLREFDLKSGETVELVGDEAGSRFTQPHYSRDGRWLFAVEMPKGKSRRTVIVGFNREHGERHAFVRKRTAQFEPFLHGERYLYYTTALCVDDCGRMIWELWRRDMLTAEQVQLTLLNAVATQPHVSEDGWLYFSGDADGGRFQIWRMRPEVGAEPEQLTSGEVRDSEPATDSRGTLYFLRKTRDGTHLMRRDADGESSEMALGLELRDLRNLEIER